MAITRLTLIRHGETEFNAEGRLANQLDSRLSSKGLAQALALAGRVAREDYDVLFVSSLGRAIETATPFATQRPIPMHLRDCLQEQSLGILAGLTWAEAAAKYPNEMRQLRSDPEYQAPGGESYPAFYKRTIACLDEIVSQNQGKRIVVVAHGGTLDCAYRRARGLSPTASHSADLHNASLNVVTVDGDDWTIESWGDIAHHPKD